MSSIELSLMICKSSCTVLRLPRAKGSFRYPYFDSGLRIQIRHYSPTTIRHLHSVAEFYDTLGMPFDTQPEQISPGADPGQTGIGPPVLLLLFAHTLNCKMHSVSTA